MRYNFWSSWFIFKRWGSNTLTTIQIVEAFRDSVVLNSYTPHYTHDHNLGHTFSFPSIALSITQRKSGAKKMKGVNNAWNIDVSNHHCLFKWNWLLLISQITHIWLAHRCRGYRKQRDSEGVSLTHTLSISLQGINDVCLIIGWI